MNSFIQSDASQHSTSDLGTPKPGNFKSRTAALAIGTIAAVMTSLVLASAATTSDDQRPEATSGATVQKSLGRCKARTLPTALAM